MLFNKADFGICNTYSIEIQHLQGAKIKRKSDVKKGGGERGKETQRKGRGRDRHTHTYIHKTTFTE